jgi:hypothetical protein
MSELKPCPYCGCDQIQWHENKEWIIPFARYCRNCRSYGPHKETLEEADIAWNTRASDQQNEALLAQVERIRELAKRYMNPALAYLPESEAKWLEGKEDFADDVLEILNDQQSLDSIKAAVEAETIDRCAQAIVDNYLGREIPSPVFPSTQAVRNMPRKYQPTE